MNPRQIWVLLVMNGYSPQQASQAVQQYMSQSGPGSTGAADVVQQLIQAFASQQGLQATKRPYDLQMQVANSGVNNPLGAVNTINQMTKGLDRRLINAVTAETNPSIQQRGLGTSPGMSQYITAKALAPYQLQEQQMAQQQYQYGNNTAFNVGSGIAGSYPQSLAELPYLMQQIGSQP